MSQINGLTRKQESIGAQEEDGRTGQGHHTWPRAHQTRMVVFVEYLVVLQRTLIQKQDLAYNMT